MTQGQRELLGYLEQHIRRARQAGVRLTVAELALSDWLAMGRPELAFGVRVRLAAPPTRCRRAVS
ncbi:hypothetical protein [uncultured Halomonas sp.]|uniref:hypothetical protein n=1 Tax=uncultured Halomonas sp. TaxID=173971 RepID=UPI00260A920B|nr:hypothetical protein [uncultured Halomonas sp.]